MARRALTHLYIPLLLSFACSGSEDDAATRTGADGNSANDTGDESATMGTPAGAPVVMELLANTAGITEREPIIFTAIVVDPDGLDTIVGGKLMTWDGEAFYGAFAHIGGGTFQIALSWELIGQSSKIEFTGALDTRMFLADFIDIDGNHGTKTIKIELRCDTGAACNSVCLDIDSRTDNCGQCGRVCALNQKCYDGECSYPD